LFRWECGSHTIQLRSKENLASCEKSDQPCGLLDNPSLTAGLIHRASSLPSTKFKGWQWPSNFNQLLQLDTDAWYITRVVDDRGQCIIQPLTANSCRAPSAHLRPCPGSLGGSILPLLSISAGLSNRGSKSGKSSIQRTDGTAPAK